MDLVKLKFPPLKVILIDNGNMASSAIIGIEWHDQVIQVKRSASFKYC